MASQPGSRQLNWRNLYICFLLSLGMVAFGYPSSIIGTTLGEPSFLIYMKLLDPVTGKLIGNADGLIGAMSGVFQAGAFFGVIAVCYLLDKWGRKAGVIFAALISILGGALLCGSNGIAMFIVGRFFAGMGSWAYFVAIPVYASELAPPDLRGFFVGLDGVMVAVGYALASYMGLAFYYTKNPATQWRAPLGLALIWQLMMLVIVAWVPESPRWLLMHGKVEQAKEIVMKIHAVKGDVDSSYARGEFYQMHKQADLDRTLACGWLDLIRKPSYRKRLFLSSLFAFTGQSTGVLVLNNYGPTIYKSLGYGTRDQLILQSGWITVGVFFTLIGSFFMDRLGRRPFAFIAFFGCAASLTVEAAMVASFAEAGTNIAGLRTGVAAAYVFLAFYAVGVDVVSVVLYAELFPNHIRAKGIAVAIAVNALADLVYLEVAATAFATIGWKFYLVFIILTVAGGTTMFFTLPETRCVPLEEMAKIFGDSDEVMVYMQDVHIDHNTNELVVEAHDRSGATSLPAEPNNATVLEKDAVDERIESV